MVHEKKKSPSICLHKPCLLWAQTKHRVPMKKGEYEEEERLKVIPSWVQFTDEWLFTPTLKHLAPSCDILSWAHLYRQHTLHIRFQILSLLILLRGPEHSCMHLRTHPRIYPKRTNLGLKNDANPRLSAKPDSYWAFESWNNNFIKTGCNKRSCNWIWGQKQKGQDDDAPWNTLYIS